MTTTPQGMADIAANHTLALRAMKGEGPILVGPWISEVGFELLYWIPFVASITSGAGVDPSRLVVVTRGGAHVWYHHLAKHHADIFDLLTVDEFRTLNAERIALQGGQKHTDLGPFDQRLLRLARKRLGLSKAAVLHPSTMYNMMRRLWAERESFHSFERHLKFSPLSREGLEPIEGLPQLPESYVAVRFYHSASFPATSENREFAWGVVENLARRSPVVLLETGLRVDDHNEINLPQGPGIIRMGALCTPANNLAVQTHLVANATAFYGTYGGFSYLAPMYGVRAVGFYSDPTQYKEIHRTIAARVFQEPGFGSLLTLDVAEHKLLRETYPL